MTSSSGSLGISTSTSGSTSTSTALPLRSTSNFDLVLGKLPGLDLYIRQLASLIFSAMQADGASVIVATAAKSRFRH